MSLKRLFLFPRKEVRNMLKVLDIDCCEYCDGEAYLYAGEYKDGDVERPVYQAWQACKGAGEREKAISLREAISSANLPSVWRSCVFVSSSCFCYRVISSFLFNSLKNIKFFLATEARLLVFNDSIFILIGRVPVGGASQQNICQEILTAVKAPAQHE